MKRITIDPITRLEGHGKIEIFTGITGRGTDFCLRKIAF